jgi:hypothetical protein
MTEFCDWIAVIFMFFALALEVLEARTGPTPPSARWSWACACVAFLAYFVPIALHASGIAVS